MDKSMWKLFKGLIIIMLLLSKVSLSFGQTAKDLATRKKDGRSNIRFKELSSKFTRVDKAFYKKQLTFPVERECIISPFIDPDESTSSELITTWSILVSKFVFTNEEMISDSEAQDFLRVLKPFHSRYFMVGLAPLLLLLMFVTFSIIFIFIIPIIGCILFSIFDFFWKYCISIAFKQIIRRILIMYYKGKFKHILRVRPEHITAHHFRIPKYFRNDDDPDELFLDLHPTTMKLAGTEHVHHKIKSRESSSSEDEVDIDKAYKDIMIEADEFEQEAKLTAEQRKLIQKERRHLIASSKGRRQSVALAQSEFGSSSDEEDMERANLSLWQFQLKENALYNKTKDKPLNPADVANAKKTLLQELRDEKETRLKEIQKDEFSKVVVQNI